MKRYDVVALGELLIDFTENGVSSQGNPVFEANPGGAPCNVLAMLRKLDRTCAFIGKVGDDMFGRQLKAAAEEAGIDISALLMDREVHTTLAFVKTFANGDRDFSFYRDPGADMMLTESELPREMLRDTRIFHFGTLSMTHENVRQATRTAVKTAKEAGAVISFDPNLRPPLWKDLEDAREQMSWGLAHCDVLKISDNEIEFLTGTDDFDRGVGIIREKWPGIRLINVTAGPDGSYGYAPGAKAFVPAFLLGGTIETTGAGDTFCASVLNFILERGLDGLSQDDLKQMLRFANAAAYLVTTKKGAIRSMPERAQVETILNEH
jgi:fructokinase